tara:strand:+ start:2911 stop:3087 length:177 start_codon:yes stop_codon:yes gene_type:complete
MGDPVSRQIALRLPLRILNKSAVYGASRTPLMYSVQTYGLAANALLAPPVNPKETAFS